MGRRRKYFSKEDYQLAHAIYSKKYYWNNKDEMDAKARERYRVKHPLPVYVSGSFEISDEELAVILSNQEIDGKQ